MKRVLLEGLELMQQMVGLPFRAARETLSETRVGTGPVREIVKESLDLGEGLARLPFKAVSVVVEGVGWNRQSLEQRVTAIEQRLGAPPRP